MRSRRRLAALALSLGIAGVGLTASFAPREPDPPPAVSAEPAVTRSELPRFAAGALLGGGLVGLALLGRKRLA